MTKRAERRLKQKMKDLEKQKEHTLQDTPTQDSTIVKSDIKNPFLRFYDKNYKKLLIIPIVIFLLAILQISIQATTGDFINKDISLKGGITSFIPTERLCGLSFRMFLFAFAISLHKYPF